jgi:hypothetical protein
MKLTRKQRKLSILGAAFALTTAWSLPAAAGTSLELLRGWNYNEDFNGDTERTILTIKTFQPWEYGTFFMYYDITGPFSPPDSTVLPNEKGGFFGSTSVAFSIKRIGEKITGSKWDWGNLLDWYVRYELEHVSKFGSLSYYGMQFDLKIPGFDFVGSSVNIRDDWSLSGVDLQIGSAWQITFPVGTVTDVVFAGFFAWGLFGEGTGVFTDGFPNEKGEYATIPVQGRPFFLSQPQLMLDVGKLARVADGKVLAGIEYQIALNRYLQKGIHENVAQLLFRWNI